MAVLIPKILLGNGSQSSPSVKIGNSGIYATDVGMAVTIGSQVPLQIDDKGIKVGTGSATAPSLSFISSTDSGIFLSPSGPAVSVNGVEVGRFTVNGLIMATGNVTLSNPILAYRTIPSSAVTFTNIASVSWAGPTSIDNAAITFGPSAFNFSPSQTGYYYVSANINIASQVNVATRVYEGFAVQMSNSGSNTEIGSRFSYTAITPADRQGVTIPISDILNLYGGNWYSIRIGRSSGSDPFTLSTSTSYLQIIKLF